MDCVTVLVLYIGKMERILQVSGSTIKQTEKENLFILMGICLSVSGKMIRQTDRVNTLLNKDQL